MKNTKSIFKFTLGFLLSLCIHHHVKAQSVTFNWAIGEGGTSTDFAAAISTDADDNVYVTGTFAGTADFDPSSATFNLTSAGDSDIFIQKFNASGSLVWARSIGGTLRDMGHAICVDNYGNVIVTGGFRGLVDFNPGTGVDTMRSCPQTNGTYHYDYPDIFILKLNSSGEFVWSKRIGLSYADYGVAVHCDANNNIILGGNWENYKWTSPYEDTLDADPGSGFYGLTKGGTLVLKLSAAGDFIWAKQYGYEVGTGSVQIDTYWYTMRDYSHRIKDMCLGDQGKIYIAFKNAPFANRIANSFMVIDSNGNTLMNEKRFAVSGVSNKSYGTSITVDLSGNILLGGYFIGTVDVDPSASTVSITSAGSTGKNPKPDGFVVKFNDTGKYIWVVQTGNSGDDRVNDVKTDASGAVYATGMFTSKVDFNPASGTKNVYYLTSKGLTDAFLAKYSNSGAFVLANQSGGTGNDRGEKIALGSGENVAVHSCGAFSGTADLNPTSGTQSVTSNGSTDVFVQKISISSSEPVMEDEVYAAAEPEIYPNPVTEILHIVLSEPTVVIVYDVNGKAVYSCNLNSGFSEIDISGFHCGMYILKLKNADDITTFRILKN